MKVLVFGEILYDVYGDKRSIGGAPYNFSVQIARMIKEPLSVKMISAVGDDIWGKQALEFTQKEQIDISLIQVLSDFSTGQASVFLDEHKVPDYLIHEQVAWDHMLYSAEIHKALEEEYDIFYFNLLAQRFHSSFETLCHIMKMIKAKHKVFDITLRKHYYSQEKLELALHCVDILKMNEEECELIGRLFCSDVSDYERILRTIQKDFHIPYVCLTLGEKGAYLLNNGELLFEACEPVEVVDTIGAGDAFCAALSYGIAKGLPAKEVIEFASCVAGEIVQHQGGSAFIDIASIQEKFD